MEFAFDSFVCFFTAAFLFSLAGSTDASIHFYNRDPFREVGNAFLLSGGSEGVVLSRITSPLDQSPATSVQDGRSYIRFENITFTRRKAAADMSDTTGLIQVVIFESADRDNIGGSAYGGQRSICCTSDLAKLEGCKQGDVIRFPSATDLKWPIVLDVQFNGNELSTKMENKEVFVTKTGMYNLFFISCDPKLSELTMSGRTIWKNPDGYLPARMAPLMKFYVVMCIAYVFLSIIWLFQYVRFWNDILQIQHSIAVVIGLGLFEVILWYFEYARFDSTGIRPMGITTWVVTVGAIRKTLSRLLILSVSMGFGVVRPTLGGLTTKVLLIGVTYLIATELLNITEYVGTINDVAGRARVLLVLPDAFLDAFLILWIFTSLSKTLEQLQAKRSFVKLEIYKKFSNALAGAVLLSVVWIGYEVYFKATDPFNERWESAWIITAFWDVLAFALLCVICYLWSPSQNSQRYAYSSEIGEEDLEGGEESQTLCSGRSKGEIGLIKQENADDSSSEDEEDKRE
ncbi:transmembrane protein 87B-like [Impatiens glandulifera]|uniref:transmembrane protein 87B-like n=1 Tax=Impatiens glandulifera TaxID=253017 RepID=UPI001FB1A026|nr:transmembrane protein 87B-like [Impatiens glandulifera]